MQFFSHAKDTDQGRVGTKLLFIHLQNVQNLFKRGLIFANGTSDKKEKLGSIAIFHDMGKIYAVLSRLPFRSPKC